MTTHWYVSAVGGFGGSVALPRRSMGWSTCPVLGTFTMTVGGVVSVGICRVWGGLWAVVARPPSSTTVTSMMMSDAARSVGVVHIVMVIPAVGPAMVPGPAVTEE